MGSSPFYTPQPQEDYMGTYSRWNNMLPQNDMTSYLDPNDPEIAAYRNAIAQPSGAERLVSDYTNSMPRMDSYNPSFWQRATGMGLGLLNGMQGGKNPYETAANYVEAPYKRAMGDWNNEGKFIDDRARLLEADKNREMRATEFSLKTKNAAAQKSAGLSSTRLGQVGANARADVSNQNADASREQRAKETEARLGLATGNANLARERLQFDQEKYNNPKYKPVAPPDVTDRAREMEASSKISDRAKTDAENHPTFKQYFITSPDGTVTLNPDTPVSIKASIMKFVQARISNYKLGLAPEGGGGF